MTEGLYSVDSFLSELKASLANAGHEAILRRINTERLIGLLADEFVETHQAERVRILPDNRLAGESGADFLLQIDDYDVRLELVDTPEGKPVLDNEQLPRLLALLEANPSTMAVILVWTTDDLLAVPLTTSRIRRLLEHPLELNLLVNESEPLPTILRTLVTNQVRDWDVSIDKSSAPAPQPGGVRGLFEKALDEAIDRECGRSYKFTERRQAAKQYRLSVERRLVLQVLEDALSGAEPTDLVARLAHPIRRGDI